MHHLLVLKGDGIGPEIMDEALKVLNKLNFECDVEEALIGGAAYDEHQTPLPQDTMDKALKADAVLLGAVGGPRWENVPFDKRPEAALLGIRKALGLYANLRPATVFEELADASTLKKEFVSGLDIMIVRELTGGLYFGSPRGVREENGQRIAFNTLVYSEEEIERIARTAFTLALQRNQKVTSVDKANVLESMVLWREVVTRVGKEYPDVQLNHMYVDNAAMQLVKNPKQFDVIVTENMFGDILSDCASELTGSLGMLPSASLGNKHALYEPIHGSAPDIAGRGIANPIAAILSLAMMLKITFDRADLHDKIYAAVKKTLASGARTKDIWTEGKDLLDTAQMGDNITANL